MIVDIYMWNKNSSKFFYNCATLDLLECLIKYSKSHSYSEVIDRLFYYRSIYQNYFDNLWVCRSKQKTLFDEVRNEK